MFRFNFDKAMQALGVLLKQPGKDQSSYLKLIKLLYIAEKESLQETGRPITGDKTCAMEHGPVLSHMLDLMRGQDWRPGWDDHFETSADFQLKLRRDIGEDLLCTYEIQKLKDISDRHKEYDRWAMRDETHKFPEWQKNNPGDSSREIPLRDILEQVGKGGALQDIQFPSKHISYPTPQAVLQG